MILRTIDRRKNEIFAATNAKEQSFSHLASNSDYIIGHFDRVGEVLLFPHEILVFVSVLDIQPNNIHRHILLVKSFRNSPNIVRANIVPSALMMAKSEERRQSARSGQTCVLLEDGGWSRAREQEDVEDTGFGNPVRSGRFLWDWMIDVDPRLRCESIEDTHGRLGRVCVEERDRAIKGHGRFR